MDKRRTGRPPTKAESRRLDLCGRHGEVVFHRYSKGPSKGFRWRCGRCVGEAVTRRHRAVRALIVREAGSRCAVCGYDRCLMNLHFHHVNPFEKSFPLTQSSGRSLAAYRAEALKCVLVCANCHGEIESGLIVSPPAGTGARTYTS